MSWLDEHRAELVYKTGRNKDIALGLSRWVYIVGCCTLAIAGGYKIFTQVDFRQMSLPGFSGSSLTASAPAEAAPAPEAQRPTVAAAEKLPEAPKPPAKRPGFTELPRY